MGAGRLLLLLLLLLLRREEGEGLLEAAAVAAAAAAAVPLERCERRRGRPTRGVASSSSATEFVSDGNHCDAAAAADERARFAGFREVAVVGANCLRGLLVCWECLGA